MADGKEYVSRPDELGNIHISEEVLAVIAAAAAMEVEGVGSLAANLGSDIAELLGGKKNLSKGIHIAVEEESIRVDVSLLIKYGYTIIDVAKEVQNAVYSAIENTSGLTVECVNVHVLGVAFDRDGKKAQSREKHQTRAGFRHASVYVFPGKPGVRRACPGLFDVAWNLLFSFYAWLLYNTIIYDKKPRDYPAMEEPE